MELRLGVSLECMPLEARDDSTDLLLANALQCFLQCFIWCPAEKGPETQNSSYEGQFGIPGISKID